MANPSLQIGNSNWAIKEDNLLGYSTAGTRFVPQPITMTRASAGTRVNSSGLVETVELLGSEEVTDGGFPSGTTAWSFGAGWSLGTNKAERLVAASSTDLVQASVFPNLTSTFQISFDIEASAGSVRARLGQTNLAYVGQGSYVLYGVPSGNDQLKFQADSSFVGSITNISVKESTKNNLARVDYDGTASSLLVEPERTNLVTYSSDFSQWSEIEGALVTSNSVISPSGETNSDKFTFDGTTYGRVEKNIAVTNGNTYTFSVYLKNNNLSDVTQVWLGFSMGGQGEFVTITNEWQRYETVQVANGSNEYPRVQFTGTGSLYAWGAQMEEGSYPTSYIKTSGSTVTRNQETYTKTGISDKINSEEGVLFAEMAALSNDGTIRYLSINDGTSNNRVTFLYYSSNTNIRVIVSSGGTNVMDKNSGVSSTLDFHKVAIKWKENDFAFWLDGVKVQTDTSGLAPIGLNTLSFDVAGSGNFFGKVKQLQVFKTALSDSELVTLTT